MANRKKLTARRRNDFLAQVAACGNVSEAARSVCVSRSAAYALRDSDKAFAAEWEAAREAAIDVLEAEARRRALNGIDQPVFFQGQEIGRVRKYSDSLLMFLLKADRPGKFSQRHEHTGKGGGPIQTRTTLDLSGLSRDERAALRGIAEKLAGGPAPAD